jgi:guanylate kinase
MDPELQNFYNDIKSEIKGEHADYIKQHPEIRQVLNDYLSNILLHKPEDVYSFTKDYFSFFNMKKETDRPLKLLVVAGPSGSGKVPSE